MTGSFAVLGVAPDGGDQSEIMGPLLTMPKTGATKHNVGGSRKGLAAQKNRLFLSRLRGR